jgi:hypothetical protein
VGHGGSRSGLLCASLLLVSIGPVSALDTSAADAVSDTGESSVVETTSNLGAGLLAYAALGDGGPAELISGTSAVIGGSNLALTAGYTSVSGGVAAGALGVAAISGVFVAG